VDGRGGTRTSCRYHVTGRKGLSILIVVVVVIVLVDSNQQ
jgi:hypothetical protein